MHETMQHNYAKYKHVCVLPRFIVNMPPAIHPVHSVYYSHVICSRVRQGNGCGRQQVSATEVVQNEKAKYHKCFVIAVFMQ
jgi:hypothetical protein